MARRRRGGERLLDAVGITQRQAAAP